MLDDQDQRPAPPIAARPIPEPPGAYVVATYGTLEGQQGEVIELSIWLPTSAGLVRGHSGRAIVLPVTAIGALCDLLTDLQGVLSIPILLRAFDEDAQG
jgi:hypothetical protein